MNKLEIVNTVLTLVGDFEVDSLDELVNPSVKKVLSFVDMALNNLLSKHFYFNKVRHVKLIPTHEKTINIDPDVLTVDVDRSRSRYSNRNGKLYDNKKNTFLFEKELVADLYYRVSVEDLDHPVAYFIAVDAANKFNNLFYKNEEARQDLAREMKEASIGLAQHILEVCRPNMINNEMSPEVLGGRYRRWGVQYVDSN